MKCPKCQAENPETKQFCGDCGTLLPSPKETPPVIAETLQTPAHELATGSTFAGRYQIIEELGHGGMGKVYKVFDTDIKEKIALKLLRPEIALDKETVERFSNELKLARKISHRNVCRMFDLGRAEGTTFITMEFVPGEDLKKFIRKSGQVGAGRAVSIAKQVCEGLAEAHHLGVVHRDLKPQNIMVDEDGNARIMDFGIARSLRGKGITGAGVMIGTPEYMSPEQVEGKDADQRSDIYSLGIILYEMLTGRVPFEGDTPFTVGVKHKSELPRNPLELNPQMPRDLARLILRSLEKDKEKRFQSVHDLSEELSRIEQALPTTERIIPKHRPHTSKQVTVTFNVRKAVLPAIAAVLFVAAALVLWLVVLKKHVVRPASGKPTLAVLYFKNNTGDANLDIWRTALPELITADLAQSRYIDVVSDSQIFGTLRELNLMNAAGYAPGDLRRVAEKTAATHILQGVLTKAGTSFRINTTLEDTSSGRIIGSEMVQGEGEASFHIMVDELGRKVKTGLQLTSQEIASDIDRDVGKITSSSPEAYKLYTQGRAYHMARDYKNSIAVLEKAVTIDPEFAMAYRSMSTAYGNMGFRTKADEYGRKALVLSDRISDRERWLVEGSYHYRSEKTYDKALEAFGKVVELYPDDPIANNMLGNIHSNIEEPAKAAERYEICVKQRGAPYLSFGNLASAYERLGEYDKARAVIEGYLKTAPDSAPLHRDLADLYIYQGKYDLALSEAERAFTLDPSDHNVFANLGQAAMLKGDFARAEAEFIKLTEAAAKAGTPWRRINLVVFYASRGRYKEALGQISQATEEARLVGEPAWLGRFNFFAVRVYRGAGRGSEALQAAGQSYRIAQADGDMAFVRFALWAKGMAHLGLKSPAEAQKTADELKALVETGMNKKSIHLWRDLQAQIDVATGNYARAVENARAAVDSLPPQSAYSRADASYCDTLARAYEGSGDLAKARHAYEGLQKLTVGRFFGGDLYALSFYRLGMISEKQGDKAGARAKYERFLELWKDADPGLREVEDAKKRLAALGT